MEYDTRVFFQKNKKDILDRNWTVQIQSTLSGFVVLSEHLWIGEPA